MDLRRSSRYNTSLIPKSVSKKHNTVKASNLNIKKEDQS